MPRKSSTKSPFDVHPSIVMVRKWIDELPAKTGKTLEQWIALVQKEGPSGEKERRDWLKAVHGFGTNNAWWIAERAEGRETEGGDPEAYLKAAAVYVEAMFAGPKAGLRPIYDAILKLAKKLGQDVRVCPCKTIVPLYRRYV